MQFSSTFLLASLFLTCRSLAVPVSSTSADSDSLVIKSFDFNGSGCPAGTTFASSSGSTISASFSSFSPQITSANPTGTRQNCQAVVEVVVPAGQQITLDKVNYNGFVSLQSSNVVATHDSWFYFQGELAQKTASGTTSGPISKDVDYSSSLNGSSVWSSCGGTAILSVNIALALDNGKTPSATGFATVDSTKIGPFTTRSC